MNTTSNASLESIELEALVDVHPNPSHLDVGASIKKIIKRDGKPSQ